MMDKDKELVQRGAILRAYRKSIGLSVHKVGSRIGVSGGYIAKIERGENNPSEMVLEALAELYGKESEDLFRLYNKVENEQIKEFSKLHPDLRKTITAMSTGKNITDEEMIEIAKRFKAVAEEIIKGEESEHD